MCHSLAEVIQIDQSNPQTQVVSLEQCFVFLQNQQPLAAVDQPVRASRVAIS